MTMERFFTVEFMIRVVQRLKGQPHKRLVHKGVTRFNCLSQSERNYATLLFAHGVKLHVLGCLGSRIATNQPEPSSLATIGRITITMTDGGHSNSCISLTFPKQSRCG